MTTSIMGGSDLPPQYVPRLFQAQRRAEGETLTGSLTCHEAYAPLLPPSVGAGLLPGSVPTRRSAPTEARNASRKTSREGFSQAGGQLTGDFPTPGGGRNRKVKGL